MAKFYDLGYPFSVERKSSLLYVLEAMNCNGGLPVVLSMETKLYTELLQVEIYLGI